MSDKKADRGYAVGAAAKCACVLSRVEQPPAFAFGVWGFGFETFRVWGSGFWGLGFVVGFGG